MCRDAQVIGAEDGSDFVYEENRNIAAVPMCAASRTAADSDRDKKPRLQHNAVTIRPLPAIQC